MSRPVVVIVQVQSANTGCEYERVHCAIKHEYDQDDVVACRVKQQLSSELQGSPTRVASLSARAWLYRFVQWLHPHHHVATPPPHHTPLSPLSVSFEHPSPCTLATFRDHRLVDVLAAAARRPLAPLTSHIGHRCRSCPRSSFALAASTMFGSTTPSNTGTLSFGGGAATTASPFGTSLLLLWFECMQVCFAHQHPIPPPLTLHSTRRCSGYSVDVR